MEEKKKELEILNELESDERRNFLKLLGAGLGAFGLANLFSTNSFADEDKKKKYLFVITNGGNNPNRAILGLLCAEVAVSKGLGNVYVWMTLEGAELANKNKADKIESPIFKKFGNAYELMNKIKNKNGWFGVCPPCAEYAGAVGSDKIDFVEKAGADWLLTNMKDAYVVWM